MEASCAMVPGNGVQMFAVAPMGTRLGKQGVAGEFEVCQEANELVVAQPMKSRQRIGGRKIRRSIADLDKSSNPSEVFIRTAWSQADTLDLIDAVKTVEDAQLFNITLGVSEAPKGSKWEKVATLLPNCWMSCSDKFYLICRGKFQELRRNYQAMLRNQSVGKFFSKEVCQKMKDYFDDVPPMYYLDGSGSCRIPQLADMACTDPVSRRKCIEGVNTPKRLEYGSWKSSQSISSVSRGKRIEGLESPKGKDNTSWSPTQSPPFESRGQLPRRSSRIPKRSCRLESSVDEEVAMVSPMLKFTDVPESGSSRNSRTPVGGKLAKTIRKRARLEAPEILEAPENEDSVGELFKKNFDLLRSNIDTVTESHLHKHLHKHFNLFEDRMTGLIEKVDEKIGRLDQKFEAMMGSLRLVMM